MAKIEPIQDTSGIRRSWEKIFKSNDPFCIPFQPKVNAYQIFFPTVGVQLTESQYEAVTMAARLSGDHGFVISEVEVEGDFFKQGKHWWCEFPKYEDYLELPLYVENALYSIHSHWGVLISHENHAVVGGSEPFIAIVLKMYPNCQSDIIQLINYWMELLGYQERCPKWITNMFGGLCEK